LNYHRWLPDDEDASPNGVILRMRYEFLEMIKKRYWILSAVIVFAIKLSAQDTIPDISLDQLLDSAIQNNYLLQANEKQTLIRHSEIEILKTNYLPKIGASVSASYWKWLMPNKQKMLGSGNTDVYTDVSVYQTVYEWGVNKMKKAVVNDEIQLNAEIRRQIQNTIIWGVSDAYVELLKIQAETEVYRNSIHQLQSQLQFAENLYNIGKASEVDVLRIRVRILVEEKNYQKSLNAESAQYTIIKRLCNMNNKSVFSIETEIKEITNHWKIVQFNPDSIYNQISINHPVLAISKTKIQREFKQKELYKLQTRPEIFSYGVVSWEHGYIPYNDNFNYNIGLGIHFTLPYLGGSGYKTKMLQSNYKVAQLTDEVNQVLLDIKKEVDLALNEWKDIQDKIKSMNTIIDLSQKALNNAEVLYQSGQGSIIDIIDSQTILTESTINLQKSTIALLQVVAKINYLSGNDNYPF